MSEGRGSLYRERVRKERALASIREHELARLQKKWDDGFEDALSAVFRQARSGFLAIPGRVASRLAHLSREDIAVIDDEVRVVLTLMANGLTVMADGAPIEGVSGSRASDAASAEEGAP